ncbi:MAG TPA: non-canonical purine NTP pyrophosphatase [Bacteriovoracaceae bacterium]|nr:non-canonical purine NTP pyrophosphatase [Bacteriovoracaceae bacterium]
MNFILASSNSHKAEEFSELFSNTINISSAPEAIDVDETGTTFQENAFIKAQSYFKKFKTPTLADDSGLVLDAFPELLGVQSARFAPESPSYTEKCQKLLNLYSEKDIKERTAHFVCVLCFYLSDEEVYFFEGRMKGEIAHHISGDHGFGYDPIFIPEGKPESVANLPEWKNEFSHRARAVKNALSFFKENVDKTQNKL